MFKTLIHCALLCEAQALINFYKLSLDNSLKDKPKQTKIYTNDNLVILISGIGKSNTQKSLTFTLQNFKINRSINLGIAGCVDESINIGSLFCTYGQIQGVKNATITCLDTPCVDKTQIKTTLVDMESKYFYDICKLDIKEIYIIKVVSDHLDATYPKKSFVIQLIQNTLKKWKHIL